VLPKLAYLALCRSVQLLGLLARGDAANDLELLVLRHQLAGTLHCPRPGRQVLPRFDEVFRSDGTQVLMTPVRAPKANAHAERWIRTVRAQCLDWLLILGRGHLERILRVYARHYNEHRPHRALGLQPPDQPARLTVDAEDQQGRVRRRDLLGGLLHEYRQAA
jgi:putative transposase